MSDPASLKAVQPTLPTATLSTAVGTAGKLLDLSAFVNQNVTFRCSKAWHPRAADGTTVVLTAGSATAGDLPHDLDKHYHYVITKGTQQVSVYAASAGTIYYGKSNP